MGELMPDDLTRTQACGYEPGRTIRGGGNETSGS